MQMTVHIRFCFFVKGLLKRSASCQVSIMIQIHIIIPIPFSAYFQEAFPWPKSVVWNDFQGSTTPSKWGAFREDHYFVVLFPDCHCSCFYSVYVWLYWGWRFCCCCCVVVVLLLLCCCCCCCFQDFPVIFVVMVRVWVRIFLFFLQVELLVMKALSLGLVKGTSQNSVLESSHLHSRFSFSLLYLVECIWMKPF